MNTSKSHYQPVQSVQLLGQFRSVAKNMLQINKNYNIRRGKTDLTCYYFKKLLGFITTDIFPHNMLPSSPSSVISALIVHTFCFTDLHSFDLKGISLHLLPFIASESSAAPVGAAFAFLWERCTFRLGKDGVFFPTHDKAMKYDIDTQKLVLVQIGRIQNMVLQAKPLWREGTAGRHSCWWDVR